MSDKKLCPFKNDKRESVCNPEECGVGLNGECAFVTIARNITFVGYQLGTRG